MAIDCGPLRTETARELISALIRDGIAFDRGSGSHQICRRTGVRRVRAERFGIGVTSGGFLTKTGLKP